MICLTAAGFIAAAIARGPRFALGFLAGAAISFVSYFRWRRFVGSLGVDGRTRPSTLVLALWPVALVGLLYVILKYSGINLMAVFLGLFVYAAAVSIQAVYQHYAGT